MADNNKKAVTPIIRKLFRGISQQFDTVFAWVAGLPNPASFTSVVESEVAGARVRWYPGGDIHSVTTDESGVIVVSTLPGKTLVDYKQQIVDLLKVRVAMQWAHDQLNDALGVGLVRCTCSDGNYNIIRLEAQIVGLPRSAQYARPTIYISLVHHPDGYAAPVLSDTYRVYTAVHLDMTSVQQLQSAIAIITERVAKIMIYEAVLFVVYATLGRIQGCWSELDIDGDHYQGFEVQYPYIGYLNTVRLCIQYSQTDYPPHGFILTEPKVSPDGTYYHSLFIESGRAPDYDALAYQVFMVTGSIPYGNLSGPYDKLLLMNQAHPFTRYAAEYLYRGKNEEALEQVKRLPEFIKFIEASRVSDETAESIARKVEFHIKFEATLLERAIFGPGSVIDID